METSAKVDGDPNVARAFEELVRAGRLETYGALPLITRAEALRRRRAYASSIAPWCV